MLRVVGMLLGVLVVGPDPVKSAPDTRVLDLNTATMEELLTFKGIGRQYAEKIIRARPFAARSELVDRHVIPPSVYLAIRHRLFTSASGQSEARVREGVPAGMLDLNRATRDELLGVPGVGVLYADRIIAARPFRTEVELVGRRILPLAAYERVQSYLAVER